MESTDDVSGSDTDYYYNTQIDPECADTINRITANRQKPYTDLTLADKRAIELCRVGGEDEHCTSDLQSLVNAHSEDYLKPYKKVGDWGYDQEVYARDCKKDKDTLKATSRATDAAALELVQQRAKEQQLAKEQQHELEFNASSIPIDTDSESDFDDSNIVNNNNTTNQTNPPQSNSPQSALRGLKSGLGYASDLASKAGNLAVKAFEDLAGGLGGTSVVKGSDIATKGPLVAGPNGTLVTPEKQRAQHEAKAVINLGQWVNPIAAAGAPSFERIQHQIDIAPGRAVETIAAAPGQAKNYVLNQAQSYIEAKLKNNGVGNDDIGRLFAMLQQVWENYQKLPQGTSWSDAIQTLFVNDILPTLQIWGIQMAYQVGIDQVVLKYLVWAFLFYHVIIIVASGTIELYGLSSSISTRIIIIVLSTVQLVFAIAVVKLATRPVIEQSGSPIVGIIYFFSIAIAGIVSASLIGVRMQQSQSQSQSQPQSEPAAKAPASASSQKPSTTAKVFDIIGIVLKCVQVIIAVIFGIMFIVQRNATTGAREISVKSIIALTVIEILSQLLSFFGLI